MPSLRSMEVGIDFMGSERSYDLVLIATFDDEAGLAAYDKHPSHEEVRAFIRAHRTGTVSVDYKVEEKKNRQTPVLFYCSKCEMVSSAVMAYSPLAAAARSPALPQR